MASGSLRNRKTKKIYNVKNIDAVLKKHPRTFDVIPPKQLPKEVIVIEEKLAEVVINKEGVPGEEAQLNTSKTKKESKKNLTQK